MSSAHQPPPSSSNFQSILNAALKEYKKKTGKELTTHPLFAELQNCRSPDSILAVLQEQARIFDGSRGGNERLMMWLTPTVNILYSFSATLGEGVGLVFSPAKVIFAGIGVLLMAAKGVGSSQDALLSLFERIENFFKRLQAYTEVPPTAAMTHIIVKIMAEVLSILAIATKEIKQKLMKTYLKKLAGRTDIEDALQRLDQLTQEEARMAIAQMLKTTSDIKDDGKEVKVAVEQIANNVDDLHQSQVQDNLWKWLSPPDPSTNHNIACKAHHKRTAEWFFQCSIFKEWKSATGSLLWVHGKPGSGKSILCSTIIHDVNAMCEAGLATMAYFYFDFRDVNKQNLHNLLLSLLIQLSAQSNPRCGVLSRVYSTHGRGARQPSDDVLMECLKEMLSLPAQAPTYIIMDALDECSNTSGMPCPREEVLDFVKELVDLGLQDLRVCVTSRPEIDIKGALEPLTSRLMSLHDQSGQSQDILEYVSSVVSSDTKMRRWREDDRELVIQTLFERADGMFRWVFCQLEMLRHCLPPSVKRFLNELPDTLDETYERVLREIHKTNRDHAHRLLQCLTVSIRPLRIEELAEILAMDFGAAQGAVPTLNTDWRWEDQEQAVLSACSSLVSIVIGDGGSKVVQFSHFSVKEFLCSNRLSTSSGDVSRYHIPLEPAHTIIAQACLGMLLQLGDQINDEDLKSFPLAEYAALYWMDHVQFENVFLYTKNGIDDLLDSDKPHFTAWVWLRKFDNTLRYYSTPPKAVPLYYVAFCGFYGLAEHLVIKHPQTVNVRGAGDFEYPLVVALFKKHFDIAELLIKYGGDVDVRGSKGQTPLHKALSWPHRSDVIPFLLKKGADVNIRQDDLSTPLHVAAVNGNVEAVGRLCEHNVEVNLQDRFGNTPLHLSSQGLISGPDHDYIGVMRILMAHGADVAALDKKSWTPLHWASFNGKVEAARILLEHGANVHLENNKGKTPYQMALANGHQEIAQMLSEHGGK